MLNEYFRLSYFPSGRWRSFVILACIAAVTTSLAEGAAARSRHRGEVSEKKQKAEEPAPPSKPMFFVISLNNQHVSVYSNEGLYARAPVSTGMRGHPTPMGIFTILGKERLHHSNIYSGAPMPYMQRITWSGVAMHEGVLPGYPASHGCIRMPHEFARRMYGMTQGNERVVISRQDVAPAPFSHPKLPVPALLPEPGPDTVASISSRMLQNALATADDDKGAGGAEKVSVKADASEATPAGAAQKLLNPYDFAKAMKARAAKKVEEASAATNPVQQALIAKVKEMRVADVDVRKAKVALINAKDHLETAERQLKKASNDQAVSDAIAAKTEAEAKIKEAEEQVAIAEHEKAERQEGMAGAMKAFKDLDRARMSAADEVKSWNRRLAPLSVFISRKTQRLYVRQNNMKVFDVPITIRDPEKPLGTHLFIAMQPEKTTAPVPKLRWLVITIPESSAESDRPRKRHSRYYDDEDDDAPRSVATASASAALDRIEVPAEVASKISEMLWAGAALIVADSGISRETDDDTDFVVLTR